MQAVLLTVHALIVLALIVIVLLQRSEGGALGMGGGGGGGGFMTSRGAANVLTRTTSVLAALFFLTSIGLALLARNSERDADIVEELTGEKVLDPTKPLSTEDLLNTLGTGAAPGANTVAPVPAPDPATPEAAESLDLGAAIGAPVETPSGEIPAAEDDGAQEPPPN